MIASDDAESGLQNRMWSAGVGVSMSARQANGLEILPPRCRPITEVGNADAFRSCRGRSNFLAMGFTRRTVMFDPTPSSIKNSVVQADGDFESRLGFGDTGFADRARVQILGGRGPGAGSGVLQGSKTMPAKRAPTGGKGDDGGAPGGYVQVFLYRVPKANHDSFAATEEKLFAIFRRHGIVGSDLYVCGTRGFSRASATSAR